MVLMHSCVHMFLKEFSAGIECGAQHHNSEASTGGSMALLQTVENATLVEPGSL